MREVPAFRARGPVALQLLYRVHAGVGARSRSRSSRAALLLHAGAFASHAMDAASQPMHANPARAATRRTRASVQRHTLRREPVLTAHAMAHPALLPADTRTLFSLRAY